MIVIEFWKEGSTLKMLKHKFYKGQDALHIDEKKITVSLCNIQIHSWIMWV
jgi:hypothetical protein